MATFGDMRLLPKRIDSMASGMPWPRIFSVPNRAMSPTMTPPIPVVAGDGRFVGMIDRDRLARGGTAAPTAADLFDDDDAAVALTGDTCRKAAQVMAKTGLARPDPPGGPG
jgi:hypothetical protein